jgi:hypothetical protein
MTRLALIAAAVLSASVASAEPADYDFRNDLEKVKADQALACQHARVIATRSDGGAMARRYANTAAIENAYEQELAIFTKTEALRMASNPSYTNRDCEQAGVTNRVALVMLIEPKRS